MQLCGCKIAASSRRGGTMMSVEETCNLKNRRPSTIGWRFAHKNHGSCWAATLLLLVYTGTNAVRVSMAGWMDWKDHADKRV